MARPRKNDNEKRVDHLHIRLTKDETKRINAFVKTSGLDTAHWVRQRLLTGKFPLPKIPQIDADTYKELRKIGVNVNQAVHKLNQTGDQSDYLIRSQQLFELINKIANALVNPTHDR
jgi:hypothetical protein